MKILHICAGWQKWNGAANIARMIMDEQRREGHEVSFATWAKVRELRAADEVWIHCGWLPCLWWAALWGRNFRWMPEACYDPVRLGFHGWKKWLVGPIERWCLRRCSKIVATCETEAEWIRAYEPRVKSIEVTDIKRFFNLNPVNPVNPVIPSPHAGAPSVVMTHLPRSRASAMTRPKFSERVGRTRTSHQSQTFSSSSPKAEETTHSSQQTEDGDGDGFPFGENRSDLFSHTGGSICGIILANMSHLYFLINRHNVKLELQKQGF